MLPPASRMAPLTDAEFGAALAASTPGAKYAQAVDRESAREMLAARMAKTQAPAPAPGGPAPAPSAPISTGGRAGKTVAQVAGGALVGAFTSTIGRQVGREIVRGIFGLLGANPGRTSSRTSRW